MTNCYKETRLYCMKTSRIDLGMCVLISTALAGVGARNCYQSHQRVENIKNELREDVRRHNSFPSEMDIDIAEFKEPFFGKEKYWQVTADSIRREMKKELSQKEQ